MFIDVYDNRITAALWNGYRRDFPGQPTGCQCPAGLGL